MAELQTDYLIAGAGAVGLAFADTLLAESDAEIVIVDRHGLPGGHWNDAYPFVALHQPSVFYGVNNVPLGSGRVDSGGLNDGFLELASGAEVSAYFQHVMRNRLLASGRVRYFPLCEWQPASDGRHSFRSLLSGETTTVQLRRRWVDGTYYGTSVPSTHRPPFRVAEGTRLATPNDLPQLWKQAGRLPAHFVVLGAGKTAMDVGVYLLQCGAAPQQIHWVRPRDSWMINRRSVQPLLSCFDEAIGGQALQMEALAQARDADEWFERLEAGGQMLRLDPAVRPTMFHYATISEGELLLLRRITQVLRHGHVQALEPQALVFADRRVALPADSLFIDCTARAVERRPAVPIFQPDRIVLQLVRVPQPAFSAALVAWLEAHGADDTARNALSTPVPLPDGVRDVPRATVVNFMNQGRWNHDSALRAWIRASRLDGFGKLIDTVDPADAPKAAVLARLRAASKGVPAAAARWMA
ncbi:FAD/NAD(P)-binding protein [uncultured Piscinibacter sp.]|uniref:NAD(P)-binding protein n=1 Tax=uncultured Piscinibacter sp. TaxID=1131835 RepID=UPI00262BBED7|nr:FAD/NAD(P)-binding protein [uncultured Piscinibacter sp.]